MGQVQNIEELLDGVVTLPSLPATVLQISDLVNNPDCPLSEVGKAIAADPSISLKALRLVNSAYYGLREKITSVEHSVVLLGGKVVKNLVFTAAVFDTLKGGEELLLKHNVACGVAMRTLITSGAAINVQPIEPDEAFVHGLLHDVGKIILKQYMPEEYERVEAACKEGGSPLYKVEREIIGVDHAELGMMIAKRWKLTELLANSIGGHHDLDRCTNAGYQGMAGLLAVADYLCYAAGYPANTFVKPTLNSKVWQVTGLTAESLEPALAKFFEATGDVEELVSLAA
ncbi:MAG: HDOD domain-containing protein [Candidatus Hydrogenedentota bacterium]